jgi:hypothetical protein
MSTPGSTIGLVMAPNHAATVFQARSVDIGCQKGIGLDRCKFSIKWFLFGKAAKK